MEEHNPWDDYESWDEVKEEDWDELAEIWMAELRGNISSIVVQMNFSAAPILQWQFILKAVKSAASDSELFAIAAGPMEHLLGAYGPDFIEQVEEAAKKDTKFAKLLTGVWKHTMQEDVWARVQAIVKKNAIEKEEDEEPYFSDEYYDEVFRNSIEVVVKQLGSYGEDFIKLIEKKASEDLNFASKLHEIANYQRNKTLLMRLKAIATKYTPPEN